MRLNITFSMVTGLLMRVEILTFFVSGHHQTLKDTMEAAGIHINEAAKNLSSSKRSHFENS